MSTTNVFQKLFITASTTSAGGRAANQDQFGHIEIGNSGCWVVADGLGGHAGGATASRIAVDAVLSSFRSTPAVTAEGLRAHVAAANAAIRRQQSQPGLSQMRSTVVVLLADEKRAVFGHIGDSRLYYFQDGTIRFQTQDHSVPGSLAARGEIQYDAIRFHEDRNRVLRTLGNGAEVTPSSTERQLCQGDAFLLCTDGFWENVIELEMEVDSLKASNSADWLRLMTARLLMRAKKENDNYTAIAVQFHSKGAPVAQKPRPSSKPRSLSTAEKIFWITIACLTITLLLLIGTTVVSNRLFALIRRVPAILSIRNKPPSQQPPKEPAPQNPSK